MVTGAGAGHNASASPFTVPTPLELSCYRQMSVMTPSLVHISGRATMGTAGHFSSISPRF